MASPAPSWSGCPSGGVVAGGRNLLPFVGRQAALLSAGQAVEIPCSALNTLDGTGIYPTEGRANTLITNWTTKMVWDAPSQRAIIYAETAGAIGYGGIWSVLLWFDAKLNTWGHVRNPFGRFCGHGYDSNTYDPVERIHYKAPYNTPQIERWDCEAWEAMTPLTGPSTSLGPVTGAFGGVTGLAWHPHLGSQGSLIWCDSSLGRLYRWDRASQVWTQIHANATIRGQTVAHYNPQSDSVVCGGANIGDPLYFVSATGVVTASSACPQTVLSHADGQLFFPDLKRSKAILLSPASGHVHELDMASGAWADVGAFPVMLSPTHPVIGCPIPEYNCYLFMRYGSSGASKAYLYKHTA